MADTPAWQTALIAFGGAFTGGTFSLLGTTLANWLQRKREFELRLSERKQQAYIKLLMDMFPLTKEKPLVIEFLMAASDDVVLKHQRMARLNALEPFTGSKESIEAHTAVQADLILAMRRDSGLGGTSLEREDVLRNLYDMPWR
jgi:hypothetical protein